MCWLLVLDRAATSPVLDQSVLVGSSGLLRRRKVQKFIIAGSGRLTPPQVLHGSLSLSLDLADWLAGPVPYIALT